MVHMKRVKHVQNNVLGDNDQKNVFTLVDTIHHGCRHQSTITRIGMVEEWNSVVILQKSRTIHGSPNFEEESFIRLV